jgi:hypothetical protein
MTSTDALAQARRLLIDGFFISAANVLVDDAKEAARESLEQPGGEMLPMESRRDAVVNAIDQALTRLLQHRDAIRDGLNDQSDAPDIVEPASTLRKGRRKKGD